MENACSRVRLLRSRRPWLLFDLFVRSGWKKVCSDGTGKSVTALTGQAQRADRTETGSLLAGFKTGNANHACCMLRSDSVWHLQDGLQQTGWHSQHGCVPQAQAVSSSAHDEKHGPVSIEPARRGILSLRDPPILDGPPCAFNSNTHDEASCRSTPAHSGRAAQ